MDGQQAFQFYRAYSHAVKTTLDDRAITLARFAVVWQRFLTYKALDLVQKAGKQPVLLSYRSDAT
eukprot:319383-Lingulodinium_polyedra.AAC.1